MEIVRKETAQFKYRHEVPDDVLEDELDWCDAPDGYFQYHDWWFHVSEFITVDNDRWDGASSLPYWIGVFIKVHDSESYTVATGIE